MPGVDTVFPVSGLQWDSDLNLWVPLKGSITSLYHHALSLFEITVPDMKAAPYTLVIYGMTNPAAGGTGSFIL